MFGTEEVFFTNWDFGGVLGKRQCIAQNHHIQPATLVEKWDTQYYQGSKETSITYWAGQKHFKRHNYAE
jgi:hypothetical protein